MGSMPSLQVGDAQGNELAVTLLHDVSRLGMADRPRMMTLQRYTKEKLSGHIRYQADFKSRKRIQDTSQIDPEYLEQGKRSPPSAQDGTLGVVSPPPPVPSSSTITHPRTDKRARVI